MNDDLKTQCNDDGWCTITGKAILQDGGARGGPNAMRAMSLLLLDAPDEKREAHGMCDLELPQQVLWTRFGHRVQPHGDSQAVQLRNAKLGESVDAMRSVTCEQRLFVRTGVHIAVESLVLCSICDLLVWKLLRKVVPITMPRLLFAQANRVRLEGWYGSNMMRFARVYRTVKTVTVRLQRLFSRGAGRQPLHHTCIDPLFTQPASLAPVVLGTYCGSLSPTPLDGTCAWLLNALRRVSA